MNIDKIGMYKIDEILEFMTEGEGRGFLGRSMFDAMYFEIERLNNIINELEKEIDIAIKELQPNELVNGINLLKNIKFTLKELKENK